MLTFYQNNREPLAFENAGGEVRLSVQLDDPEMLGISINVGGSIETIFPADPENDWPEEIERTEAQLQVGEFFAGADDLAGVGVGALDGYRMQYEGPGDPGSESPGVLFHIEHVGVTKLDLTLRHVAGADYVCAFDATNEWGERLAGESPVTFLHLSIKGETSADDPDFDNVADALMGDAGTRRRVTQPLGGTREQYFLFVDLASQ